MIRNKGVVIECFVISLTLLLILFSRALSRSFPYGIIDRIPELSFVYMSRINYFGQLF